MNGEWLREPKNGTAVVFVHGVLSSADHCWPSADHCWQNANGAYWPSLLANAPVVEERVFMSSHLKPVPCRKGLSPQAFTTLRWPQR